MKRAVVAAAVLGLVVSMGFAASNEVSSVNIVGYNVDMVPGSNRFNLVAIQFDAFDPTLEGVFGTNQLTAGQFPAQADKVYMYDPQATPPYSSYSLKSTFGGDILGFFDTDDWFGTSVNPSVPAGTAMWLQSAQGSGPQKTVTVAGEAVAADAATNGIVSGYQLMGYPFSCERDLNDTDLVGEGTAGGFPAQADQLFLWNGAGYDSYALKDPGAPGGDDYFWQDQNAWFGATPPAIPIPLGRGFWYLAKGAFEWTEPNPYLAAFGN